MGRIHVYSNQEDSTAPWSARSYPRPEPEFEVDKDRERAVSPHRLYWKTNGVVAYGPNMPHYVDEEYLLCTWEELQAKPPDWTPPPPPKANQKGPGRPRKNPDDPKWAKIDADKRRRDGVW